MQFRSLFYGLWLGPLLGAFCIAAIRPMFFGGSFWFDLHSVMRSIGIVYLHVIVIGYPLFLLLVRYNKLHFVGFTGAGTVASVVSIVLQLLANRVLNWFSDVDTTSAVYAFSGAVIVAWAVWVVSRVVEFFHLMRGAGAAR